MSQYRVLVDDHFHYQRESERWVAGTFANAADAIACCRAIVENNLRLMFRPGMSADELFDLYGKFGDDPFIVPVEDSPSIDFSAWEFARSICRSVANEAPPSF